MGSGAFASQLVLGGSKCDNNQKSQMCNPNSRGHEDSMQNRVQKYAKQYESMGTDLVVYSGGGVGLPDKLTVKSIDWRHQADGHCSPQSLAFFSFHATDCRIYSWSLSSR